MLIAIVGLYFSLFPQYGMLNKLMYIGAVFVSVWGVTYALERRQRMAFLKRKDAELNKAHVARALNKLAQQNS